MKSIIGLKPCVLQGPISISRPSYLRMTISMLKIRRPLGRLIFNMGIAIPGKTVFLIETAPWQVTRVTIICKYSYTLQIKHTEWSKWQLCFIKIVLVVDRRLEITGPIQVLCTLTSLSHICALSTVDDMLPTERWWLSPKLHLRQIHVDCAHNQIPQPSARLGSQTTTELCFVCNDKTGAVGHVSLKYCQTVVCIRRTFKHQMTKEVNV